MSLPVLPETPNLQGHSVFRTCACQSLPSPSTGEGEGGGEGRWRTQTMLLPPLPIPPFPRQGGRGRRLREARGKSRTEWPCPNLLPSLTGVTTWHTTAPTIGEVSPAIRPCSTSRPCSRKLEAASTIVRTLAVLRRVETSLLTRPLLLFPFYHCHLGIFHVKLWTVGYWKFHGDSDDHMRSVRDRHVTAPSTP